MMKSITIKAALTIAACLTLTIHAFAQAQRRHVFHVHAGGRVPHSAGETSSIRTGWTLFTFIVNGFEPMEEIVDVNINIDMVHSWVEDLTILLQSPMGTRICLFDRLPSQSYRFDNFDNTYFNDENVPWEGTLPIEEGSPPYNGNFRPMEPLSRFRRERPNGIWKLWIFDHYYGDYGYLYKQNDPIFEYGGSGPPRWRGPMVEPERRNEYNEFPFSGGTWLEITVPEPASLLALAPALGWLLLRRRR